MRKKPKTIDFEGETATVRFPNGATLSQVPIRDLVDDSGFWNQVARKT